MQKTTKLRFIKSKNPDVILQYVASLPYKIEIKGSPVFVKNKWFLWFNLPDHIEQEVPHGDLD